MQKFDLIVVGGGQAGCAAALAGARDGLSVLLVEAAGALGGSATNCLVNPFMPYSTTIEENGEKKDIALSDGLFTEIHDALNEDGLYSEARSWIAFNEESLKVILDRKMAEAGVRVLFHATLCGVRTEGRRLVSASFATVGGVLTFEAGTFIDATGDATLSVYAGVPCRLGRPADSLCQPMTLCFRVCNVDTEDFWKHHKEINDLYKKLQAEGKVFAPEDFEKHEIQKKILKNNSGLKLPERNHSAPLSTPEAKDAIKQYRKHNCDLFTRDLLLKLGKGKWFS